MKKNLNIYILLTLSFILLSFKTLNVISYNQAFHTEGYYYKFNDTPEYAMMISNLRFYIPVEKSSTTTAWNDKKVVVESNIYIKAVYTQDEYLNILSNTQDLIRYNSNFYNIKIIRNILLEKIYNSNNDYFRIVLFYN